MAIFCVNIQKGIFHLVCNGLFFCNKFILNGELAYKTGLSQGVSDNRLEYIFWNLIEDAWFLFHVFFFLFCLEKYGQTLFLCALPYIFISAL